MNISTPYSSKASAVRGLGRYLGNALNTDAGRELDINALIEYDGDANQWFFDKDKADAAVHLDVSQEDQDLVLMCGFAHCPKCKIHLSNGLMDYDTMVDRVGEKKAYRLQKHEWACLACNHEWGKEIDEPKGAARKPSEGKGSSGADRSQSNVLKPSELVYALADAEPDAKRKDIVERAIEQGVTPNTARAAYQHWRRDRGLMKAK